MKYLQAALQAAEVSADPGCRLGGDHFLELAARWARKEAREEAREAVPSLERVASWDDAVLFVKESGADAETLDLLNLVRDFVQNRCEPAQALRLCIACDWRLDDIHNFLDAVVFREV